MPRYQLSGFAELSSPDYNACDTAHADLLPCSWHPADGALPNEPKIVLFATEASDIHRLKLSLYPQFKTYHCMDESRATSGAVASKIKFARRDRKFEVEKPYDLRYDVGDKISQTNVAIDSEDVLIKDFRTVCEADTGSTYGFSIETLEEPMNESIFDHQDSIESIYYPRIEQVLRKRYPEAETIHVLEHNLRRRHSQFPDISEDITVDYYQPAGLAHIDFSFRIAVKAATSALSLPEDQSRRIVAINLWKSLQGPGNDWPLALCDTRTIDHVSDTIIADVVYPDRYTENEFLFYNKDQKWWYASDLKDNEILAFVQKDTGAGSAAYGNGVAHASFKHPHVPSASKSRTSIEFRAFVILK